MYPVWTARNTPKAIMQLLKRGLLPLIALTGLAFMAPAMAQTTTPALENAMQIPTPSKSGYAPVNGVEVYYAVYGKGDPLILLHGGFEMMEMFGPNIALLAKNHQVIGVDLQGHGRTAPHDRPMTYQNMADDIAELITWLGFEKADVMGYSLGGGVALRLGIQHPEVVDQLILASAPYAYSGWHDYNAEGMRTINAASAEAMKQTPFYQAYVKVAQDPETNWVKLNTQLGEFIGKDYDWSAEVKEMKIPTMLIVGDWDAVRTSHTAKFFELLGGGLIDANWDASNMNANRLSILPGHTHYAIGSSPKLAEAALQFLDAPAK
jgi:pimeloyl-ACP methyl ester carboxylesterase